MKKALKKKAKQEKEREEAKKRKKERQKDIEAKAAVSFYQRDGEILCSIAFSPSHVTSFPPGRRWRKPRLKQNARRKRKMI